MINVLNMDFLSNVQTNAKEIQKASPKDIENKTSFKDMFSKITENKESMSLNEGESIKEYDLECDEKEFKRKVETFGMEILVQIADIFKIPVEDVQSKMQELNLKDINLLDENTLNDVISFIAGKENIEINSDDYNLMQDLLQDVKTIKEELVREFDLSDENFPLVLEKLNIDDKKKNVVDNSNVNKNPFEFVYTQKNINFNKTNGEINISNTQSTFPQEKLNIETNDFEEENKESDTNLFSENVFQIMPKENLNTQTITVEKFEDILKEKTGMNTKEIIQQITEKITVEKTDEKSSIEFELHPASLGHVNVILTSTKEGIDAKFITQTEVVKEVMNVQMNMLLEKFEMQNIKVNTIEVLTNSQTFDSAMEGEKENKQGQEKKKDKQRHINLDSDTFENDEQDIIIDMMLRSGNAINIDA